MIGDTLRKERESQKLSIHDIEQGTSIRALYIEAIENGDYDKLPGEVYAKGFIKNYANFLELDGDAIVKQFLAEISANVIPPNEETTAATTSKVETPPAQTSITEKLSNIDSTDSRKYIIAAVALIAVMIGGFLYNSGDSVQNDNNNVPIQQENIQPAPVEPVETQPVVNPVPPPVQTIVQGVNVKATFTGDCWTQVVTDGALTYEGTINAGQVIDWQGNQSIYVVLGNAGVVNFIVNGQNVGSIGEEGEVRDWTFVQ